MMDRLAIASGFGGLLAAVSILFFLFAPSVWAYPVPSRGTEDIPTLMAASSLVCKGEVIDAPIPSSVQWAASMPRMTATAYVRPDHCFKGTPPERVPILFDGFVSCCGPEFVLRKGDYRLFFLTAQDGKYAVVNVWFGALTISRERGAAPERADPLYLLELDLKAGLRDSNPERVLDSIRMLGNLKQLHSTAELHALESSPGLPVRTYVWQALLRLRDYSVLPAVAEFFASQPEPPHVLYMPRDRLFQMQFELQSAIQAIRDPSTLPYLERFAAAGRDYLLRSDALQSLRAINSFHSAATFLKELDDPNADNAFSSMQGLLTLAGGGYIEWVPSWDKFDGAPQYYAERCKEWWRTEGEQKAKSLSQRTLHFMIKLPDGVRADSVQIHYLAIRSGNGYADLLREPAQQNAYEFSEPAEKLRVAAYIPGCQFDTLELDAASEATQPLPCRALRSIQLTGQLTQPDLLVGKSAVLEVSYLARWANVFFGIADGSVTTFRLPPFPIDSRGVFAMSLPDFASDPATHWQGGSEWQFILRELRTGNVLARLRPTDPDENGTGLAVRASYPDVVKFTAVPN